MKLWRSTTSRLLLVAPLWFAAAWAMSLSMLGLCVVPLLFTYLPEKALAGAMAGHLFSAQTAISGACGLALLLLFRSPKAEVPAPVAAQLSLWVLAGVLLAFLVEFAVSPHIRAHDNLALWHPVGSGMYLVQWLCALWVFGRLSAAPSLLDR